MGPRVHTLGRDEVRTYLVGQLGLRSSTLPSGALGVRDLLRQLRCIQLDPLDRIGTNADLVALARVEGLSVGEVYQHLLPGHAFEHFAKERCLLPCSAWPYYRDQAAKTPRWRLSRRLERLPEGVLEAVLAEVEERGPVTAADLDDHGRVDPITWGSTEAAWKGTTRAASMALEVLWSRCQVAVVGRSGRGKLYDVPSRALPHRHDQEAEEGFARWALKERVEAAGLLARAGGPWWSMLRETRTSPLVDELCAEGALEQVQIEGSRRPYLAPAGFRERSFGDDDGRMRILAPLDPLIWDRKLVEHVFDFEYVWEVYKPAAKRRWGYYVCPLLHEGRLVGRFEGRRDPAGGVVVESLWREDPKTFDDRAFEAAIDRHAQALG